MNTKGKRIQQKLVVFESDDWGSIRMASKQAYEKLLKMDSQLDRCYFNRNDMLESDDDLHFLMETLASIKGSDDMPAKFTLNNIVANPDFEQIKADDYHKYAYEPFTKTLERYPNHSKVLEYYQEGLQNGVFQVQFHGREHVHIRHWMNELQQENKRVKQVFDMGMFSLFNSLATSTCNNEFLNAMASYNEMDFEIISNSILEGTELFEELWGFKSKSVIAPCYTWHPQIEEVFHQCHIKLIQGGKVQSCPSETDGVNYPIKHFLGETNKLNQAYVVRNVNFEPSTTTSIDWVSKALKEINAAFVWSKPAIISTHRLNYIGGLVPANRDKNLVLLRELLEKTIKKWPDVQFISTDELEAYLF